MQFAETFQKAALYETSSPFPLNLILNRQYKGKVPLFSLFLFRSIISKYDCSIGPTRKNIAEVD